MTGESSRARQHFSFQFKATIFELDNGRFAYKSETDAFPKEAPNRSLQEYDESIQTYLVYLFVLYNVNIALHGDPLPQMSHVGPGPLKKY